MEILLLAFVFIVLAIFGHISGLIQALWIFLEVLLGILLWAFSSFASLFYEKESLETEDGNVNKENFGL